MEGFPSKDTPASRLLKESGCLSFHRRKEEGGRDASARGFLLIACTFPDSSGYIKAATVSQGSHRTLLYVAPELPPNSTKHHDVFLLSAPPSPPNK